MSDRIDHVAAAKVWIENSVKAQASEQPNNEQLATAYAGIAQVHGTLALVEQQRIANLVALAQLTIVPGDMPIFRGVVWEGERLRADIREALGVS